MQSSAAVPKGPKLKGKRIYFSDFLNYSADLIHICTLKETLLMQTPWF